MSAQRKCRMCGCTQDHACITETGPCHWVAEDLCSACADGGLKLTGEDLLALRKLKPVAIQLESGAAFQLLGVLQLAVRHPGFRASHGEAFQFAVRLAQDLQEYLSVTENIALACQAGWSPHCDVPSSGPGQSSIILPP